MFPTKKHKVIYFAFFFFIYSGFLHAYKGQTSAQNSGDTAGSIISTVFSNVLKDPKE